MNFAGKLMELIMLSKICQTQKDKNYIFFPNTQNLKKYYIDRDY